VYLEDHIQYSDIREPKSRVHAGTLKEIVVVNLDFKMPYLMPQFLKSHKM